MHHYWREFLGVALAHLFAVASPGPDFAIVLHQSLRHGRRAAIWTSVGVGMAIFLHVVYSLLGIGLILKSSPLAFTVVKFAGAAYIGWLGVRALLTQPREETTTLDFSPEPPPSASAAWLTGFLTNALNPKATLFFVALFVTVIDPHTPKSIQAIYGLWMVAATIGWFSAVSVIFTREAVRRTFLRYGHWVDRIIGIVFLIFAAALTASSV